MSLGLHRSMLAPWYGSLAHHLELLSWPEHSFLLMLPELTLINKIVAN